MKTFTEALLGSFPYFRFGMRHAAQLSSGFSKEVALKRAMDYVASSGVDGDYLEFGVWRGRSFAAACYLATKRRLSMDFYAFDSFLGLPEDIEVDATGKQAFKHGDYCCSEREFLNNVRRTGADMKRVITVPGWYHESLRPDNPRLVNLKTAAIVWVDCDLYSSCVQVLDFLTNRTVLQYGTLICFDDWFRYKADPNAGEQRAFREWLAANSHLSAVELMRIGWEGNCFVIHDEMQCRTPMEQHI
jgi:O-methyltransferase